MNSRGKRYSNSMFALGYIRCKNDTCLWQVLETPHQARNCMTHYPSVMLNSFSEDEVGLPLVLTDFIANGSIAEGVRLSRVSNVLQSEVSFSGYLRLSPSVANVSHQTNMFFWFFPSRVKAAEAPLLLWLEGGPGWPTMYAVFKEGHIFQHLFALL